MGGTEQLSESPSTWDGGWYVYSARRYPGTSTVYTVYSSSTGVLHLLVGVGDQVPFVSVSSGDMESHLTP